MQCWDCLQWQQAQSDDAVTHRPTPWRTLHLQIDPAPEYRPRCNTHSFDDKPKSNHQPWWDKTATRQWRALFFQSCLVQRRWVCCCRWCLVRTCLTTGLQALSPASLSLLWTVWALMEGLCIPGVTWAVVVAILYLSRKCDVRMYQSCADVVTCGLPLRGRSGVSQYWHLQSSCHLATRLRHVHADEQGVFLLVFFRVSRKASLVS
jgi:hypothetical protein